jgi:acyl transferase domain-containing protein/acyl carrier protein
VIRQALANARLSPQDIDAVEAHGTGTTLGDPIEAGALLATYGQDRERPLKLGSLKSNIGHTAAAAGVGGVIKAVLAMREGILPKTLHVDQPSSKVDWEAGEIELLTEPVEWKANGRPRRAGVSSFGISGTNAHLILEEAPEQAGDAVAKSLAADSGSGVSSKSEQPLPDQIPLALSAKSEDALRDSAQRLAAHLRGEPELQPGDVAYSLLTTRSLFEHRAVAVGAKREQLLDALDALALSSDANGLTKGIARSQQAPVFLFPGQGSQWQGMAADLLETSPHFEQGLGECEEALSPHIDFSLRDVLIGAEGAASLERIEVVQPALFAVTVSLARLWRSCGVHPAAVLGHSQGEIAAAHISGALSLPDAARIAALRSQLIARLAGQGAMASVALPASEVLALIEPWAERIELAAQNGPSSTILSAEGEALGEFLARCEQEEIRAREIPATIPSHSARVEPLREELLEALAPISPQSGEIAFYSTVTGDLLDGQELGPEYWYRNLRRPVLFEQVTRELIVRGNHAFIEVSPHPVFALAVGETLEDALPDSEQGSVIGTLRRQEGGPDRFALSLAEAHVQGAKVEWEEFFKGSGAKKTKLPTYPFQRKRYWLSAGAGAGDLSAAGLSDAEHPLLGAAIEDPQGGGLTFTGRLSLQTHPWLADHAVTGTVLLPGTAFVELALRAGEEVDCELLEELTLAAPLILSEAGAVQIQVAVGASDEQGHREVSIHSRSMATDEDEPAQWTQNASGRLCAGAPEAPKPLDTWPPEGAEPLDVEFLYDRLAEAGLEYGPAFQGLTRAWRKGEQIFAEVSLAEEQARDAGRFGIHPALLDAALHSIALSLTEPGAKEGLSLPFAWSDVSLFGPCGSELRVALTLDDEQRASLSIADGEGAPLARVGSLSVRPVSPEQLRGGGSRREELLGIQWREISRPAGEYGEGSEAELWHCDPEPGADLPTAARAATAQALEAIQSWLAREDEVPDRRLAILTKGAIATTAQGCPDPVAAAVWGLVRSAQSEHPGRFALIDSDGSQASLAALPAALALTGEEPQLALREGVALMPRALGLREEGDSLLPPPGPWRLDAGEGGTLESLALVPNPRATEPLGPTEVRIEMRAAGLNFRDVLIALGIYPGQAPIGSEGAGVVVEVGAEVSDLALGERVMAMLPDSAAPLAVAERGLSAPIPEGWSFAQAAAMPIAFLTATYGLIDLAGLKRGEKVLIHAGAGGVGMAAIQIAQHLGAEVFATASPSKWDVLREAGIAEDHIASSRDLDFREKFLATSGGEGVDVVLDSLAREFVDASLDLLPRGGRFIEMGKTDLREAEQVAADHPGVAYRAFDLGEAGDRRMGEMLAETVELFGEDKFHPLAITSWDLRHAHEAFRHLREGKNVGKVVLEIPRPVDPMRTVLITGATGTLGGLTAKHLVEGHGARHLLLVSRSGPEAAGAKELKGELAELGAEVRIAACDVSDRRQLEDLLASIPGEHPLGAVIHAAAALDDATVDSLSAERLGPVFAPKADAAWYLHELTAGMELSAFVCFSSAAGALGSPGQGNYAAANSFLDALAQRRRAEGLAASSIAWGHWETESALSAKLDQADLARLRRSGIASLSDAQGLALFDQALGAERADSLALGIDAAGLRSMVSAGALPPILSGLVRTPRRRFGASGSLAEKLAAMPEADREAHVLELVKAEVAAVLGHDSGAAIEPERAFQELGFDSLAAVELRNRLNATTGLRLAATVVFDYPNSAALAGRIWADAGVGRPGEAESNGGAVEGEFNRLESMLAQIDSGEERDKAAARLRDLLAAIDTEAHEDLADVTDDEMFELLDKKLGKV